MKIIDADEIVYESIDSSDTAKYEYEHGTGIFAVRKEDIDAMPTIQPEPHWIPCSAGLPKTNDPVNVTYVNHNPGNYYAEVKDKPYTATAHFHKGQWYWYSCTTQDLLDEYGTWIPDLIDKDVEITAWKPLPEPYKGG